MKFGNLIRKSVILWNANTLEPFPIKRKSVSHEA